MAARCCANGWTILRQRLVISKRWRRGTSSRGAPKGGQYCFIAEMFVNLRFLAHSKVAAPLINFSLSVVAPWFELPRSRSDFPHDYTSNRFQELAFPRFLP